VTARLFDDRLSREWIGFTMLRRVIIAAAVVHFSLAAVSLYRAETQIYEATLGPVERVVKPGSSVEAEFVTAGRTPVHARIELIQGSHVEVLATTVICENKHFLYDFRSKHASLTATVPADILSRFSPGRAVIQAIGEGGSQLLYVPPPKFSEAVIQLAPR